MTSFEMTSQGEAGTRALAAALAPELAAGDLVILDGGLAAGKTTLVKGIAAELASPDVVTSPTFALAHFYRSRSGPILHIDAYRLSGLPEFRDLGLDDYIAESITLIEWGAKVAADFPARLTIGLGFVPDQPDHRLVRLRADGAGWDERLARLRSAMDNVVTAR